MTAIEKLEKYNQEHILSLLNKLDGEKKEELLHQIENLDLETIFELYNNTKKEKKQDYQIENIPFVDKSKLTKEEKEKYAKIGQKVIENGEYAVVTMAGGQGTRLGFNGPKGTYKLDIGENGKYIFEALLDTIKAECKKYGREIYWYIMTSTENNADTIKFFEEHNYFGYNKEKVKFFKQANLPLISVDGKLLINKDYKIKVASNGNGGVFSALANQGMIEDMKSKGIKWVFICGVDNIMVRPIDSIFLGLAIDKNVECASKSVVKEYPEEKTGAFCKKNGKPGVVEYTEMSEEMAYRKTPNGEWLYGEKHIVSNMFSVKALEIIAKQNLEYHCAIKKNSYLDENGIEIKPDTPNSYKFEAFIFDGFQFFDDMLIMRIDRNQEFSPIKNAEGIDSPASAKEIYLKYYNTWND